MTVLQVCAYAAPYEGNFIKSLKELSKALKEKNIKMIYAFPETAKEIPWCQELEKDTEVFYLPLAKARLRKSTYQILKTIYKKFPDISIIHSHFELYDVPVALTAPKDVRVFWHLHDAIQIYSSIKDRTEHKIQYGFCHKNATLLSVSEKHMEYVISKGFPRENALIIPNGLDTDRITCVDFSEEKTFDFLIFGWEFERKGIDLCIEAMKKLNKSFSVAVVGNDQIRERIKNEYGEVENLIVLDPVSDINTLYNISGCFLHISRAEGLSYALLEAIYAGLPVICSDISENRFAEKFETVKMVKSENIDDIAKAMEKQLENGVLSEESIYKVREMIENEYSLSKWVKDITEQYEV